MSGGKKFPVREGARWEKDGERENRQHKKEEDIKAGGKRRWSLAGSLEIW